MSLKESEMGVPEYPRLIKLWSAAVAALCVGLPLQAQEPDAARGSVHVVPALSAGALWWTGEAVIAISPAVQVEHRRGARAIAVALEWWELESDCSLAGNCKGPQSPGFSIEATHRWWIGGTPGVHPFAAASGAAYLWKVDPSSESGDANTAFRAGVGMSFGVDLGSLDGYALRAAGTYRLLTSGAEIAHGTLALRIPVSRRR
jgi:hypothetical protein